jgi:hypothetical protein
MDFNPQLASLISLSIGLGCGFALISSISRQMASKNWSTTKGEILRSDLEEDSDGWFPQVDYSYTVGKQNYTGQRIGFYTPNSGAEAYAQKQLAPYPVGKAVIVFYNPAKPEDAVLDRQVPLWRSLCWLSLTLLFSFAGIQMWRGVLMSTHLA